MSDDHDSTPEQRRSPGRHRWAALLFVVIVLGIPVVTTTVAVARFPQLSVLDEFAHIDYLRRVEDGEIPRIGQKILPETARDVACRTIGGRPVSDCQLDTIPVEHIDAQGYSFQAQQPPLYYAVTAALRQPLRLFVNGFVNSARLTGIAWSAAGLAMMWWFLRSRMKASLAATALACSLMAVCPPLIGQTSTVNNDAASLVIGVAALMGYDMVRRDPSWRRIGVLSVGAVVLVLLKPLAVLAVGVVALALVLDPQQRSRGWALAPRLVPALAAAVTYQTWEFIRDARGVVPYSVVTDALLAGRPRLSSFPLEALGVVAPRFLGVYSSLPGSNALEGFIIGVATVVGLVFIVSPSIATAMGEGRSELRHLHAALLAVALVAPPLLIAQSYVTVRLSGGANTRYALSLLPLFVTAAVPWFERTGPRRVAVVGVSLLFAVTMIGLITHDVPA